MGAVLYVNVVGAAHSEEEHMCQVDYILLLLCVYLDVSLSYSVFVNLL